jgi:hypothetical protein
VTLLRAIIGGPHRAFRSTGALAQA